MQATKLLITGADGLLGNALLQYAKQEKVKVFGFDKKGLDITDEQAVSHVIKKVVPTVILNCAVVGPQESELKPTEAQEVNVAGVKNLLVHKKNAKLVHFSSPAIFDGLPPLEIPFSNVSPDIGYSEAAKPKPKSLYGKTKWRSEQILDDTGSIIIRTSWLYSEAQPFLLAGMYARNELSRPTYCGDIWRAINTLLGKNKSGTFHVCGPEIISRCEQARLHLGNEAKCGQLDNPNVRPLSITTTLARLGWSINTLTAWRAWVQNLKE